MASGPVKPVTKLLIVGLARSGTTWVGQTLSGGEGVSYVDEPDNHYRSPFAFRAKAALPGRAYPILCPGDSAPEYTALWEQAFGLDGGATSEAGVTARARHSTSTLIHRGVLPPRLRRGPLLVRRAYAGSAPPSLRLAAAGRLALPAVPEPGARDVVVKSVYAARSVEWLVGRLPVRVLILRRCLHSVIASWKEQGWLSDANDDFLGELGPGGGRVLAEAPGIPQRRRRSSTAAGRAAWLLGCLAVHLRAATTRHPDWQVVSYEELLDDPYRLLPEIATSAGVSWTDSSDALLRGPHAPPPKPQGIDARLTAAEVSDVTAVLSEFDLRGWAW